MISDNLAMFQIGDTLVSQELAERFFCCNLNACLGACCIEGDAGAPVTDEEYVKLKQILPIIWNDLLPRAQDEIKEHGVAYIDPEGEQVTSIVDGKNCVFSCYAPGGLCECAIEKAYREGRIDFYKPVSCHLYPVRVKNYRTFTAVNYDRWKICKSAEVLGRKNGIRLYKFLKDPLIRRFGQQWYDTLVANCELYIKTYLED
jgi:hypothetical protein